MAPLPLKDNQSKWCMWSGCEDDHKLNVAVSDVGMWRLVGAGTNCGEPVTSHSVHSKSISGCYDKSQISSSVAYDRYMEQSVCDSQL